MTYFSLPSFFLALYSVAKQSIAVLCRPRRLVLTVRHDARSDVAVDAESMAATTAKASLQLQPCGNIFQSEAIPDDWAGKFRGDFFFLSVPSAHAKSLLRNITRMESTAAECSAVRAAPLGTAVTRWCGLGFARCVAVIHTEPHGHQRGGSPATWPVRPPPQAELIHFKGQMEENWRVQEWRKKGVWGADEMPTRQSSVDLLLSTPSIGVLVWVWVWEGG